MNKPTICIGWVSPEGEADDCITVCGNRIPKGTGWPHGDALIEDLMTRCHQSDVMRVIDELEEYVATMGIADRFKRDKYVGQSLVNAGYFPPMDPMDAIAGEKLNLAGHKRAALLQELRKIRSKLKTVFGELSSLRLNVEATNMDEHGNHVPKPSADELREGDFFQEPRL